MCLSDCWTLDDMIKLCDDKDINDMSKDFGLSKNILVKIR